jgi:hypothetical protein
MGVRILKILIVVNLLFGCKTIREAKMLKVAVKQGVPETSEWIGGKDGGEWVNFIVKNDTLHIDTYNDFTNQFKTRYTYKINCESSNEKQIRRAFKFTNGEKVFWDTKRETFNCLEFIEKKAEKKEPYTH